MKNLNITVNGKIAEFHKRDGGIVCGNSDYQITFAFDSEWDDYEGKTARFIWNGGYVEVDFIGNTCIVPIINNTAEIYVGVYVKTDIGVLLATTTAAIIPCYRSILCNTAVTVREPESIEAWRDAAAYSASEAATSAREAATSASEAATSAREAATSAREAAESVREAKFLYKHNLRIIYHNEDDANSMDISGSFYLSRSEALSTFNDLLAYKGYIDGHCFDGIVNIEGETIFIDAIDIQEDNGVVVRVRDGMYAEDVNLHRFRQGYLTITDVVLEV